MRYGVVVVLLACWGADADACRAQTTVRFTSNLGAFDVRLRDSAAPLTVANFLSYVNSGAYDGTIMHRSVPGFIVQGGMFRGEAGLPRVVTGAPVPGEAYQAMAANGGRPLNVRGTIAMAHRYTFDPNSATSSFFFNLVDNSSNLDWQGGGFTVFGEVVGTGMEVVDRMAALPRIRLGGDLSDLPVLGGTELTVENLVTFTSVAVVPEPGGVGGWALGVGVLAARNRGRSRLGS